MADVTYSSTFKSQKKKRPDVLDQDGLDGTFKSIIILINIGIRNPIELDLYALETSSRKMINDLIHPVITKMNEDREVIV